MNANEWSDVLGNEISATDVYRMFLQTRLNKNETLAQWIERQSAELWGNEHKPDLDYGTMASHLMETVIDQAGRKNSQ